MTGAQALTLLLARLAGRTSTTLRANCLLEMQLVQSATLEGGPFLPWFLITTDTTLATVINQRTVALPTNFIRELDEDSQVEIQDTDGTWSTLEKKPYTELVSFWEQAETSDLPENYAVVGSNLMIFPLPSAVRSIRMQYYGKGATIADSAAEPVWLANAADLVIAETGIIVASKHVREDATKVKQFQDDRDKAYARLVAANTARAEANMNRRMG